MVSVIISYCNNDFGFIEENLKQVSKFTDDICISYCTHSFDGTPEDEAIIQEMEKVARIYNAKTMRCEYQPNENAKYHHNLLRFLGLLNCENDYVLFLDADEIVEGEILNEYFSTGHHLEYDAICFRCYWYFREKKYRAKSLETAGVLVRKSICNYHYIFSQAERGEFINRRELKWLDEFKPFDKIAVHHYSWVRTKEQMLKKVGTWAHKTDKNWVDLIQEEFSRDFNGTDFVHNYKYENYDYDL